MSRAPATFRQSDVAKALKAAKQAGARVARFEIDRDGKIVVLLGNVAEAGLPAASNENDFG